ncbi:unnamed protein product [Amoebophrya sp. A25]|nr:unnamed protein product [Amoebophrya sp. A25]|eukprot:GSA25T00022486001.1
MAAGESSGDIFVAGDLASYPDIRTGKTSRAEHWNAAVSQGETAALNILGRHKVFRRDQTNSTVRTELFGKRMEFVGTVDTLQHAVVEGDVDGMNFVVYYVNQRDEITGVLNLGKPEVTAATTRLMEVSKMPKASEVIIGLVNAESLVARSQMV